MWLTACAAMPEPASVSEADAVAESPAAQEAALLAPQAHARALALRKQADARYEAGDLAGAEILGEHAVAAMSRAFVVARLVKAQKRLATAQRKLTQATEKLAKLDEQAQRITAEADNLELRVKVVRDAEPMSEIKPGSPERERARRNAARTLLSQALLLCQATRLLAPERKGLAERLEKLATLEASLKSSVTPDITRAMQARSDCLQELTLVRRPELLKAPAQGLTDALLEQLTKTEKFFAFRDDRGVVVVLRNVLSGGKPTESGNVQLTTLARVAKAHPKFPLLVVVHSAKKASDEPPELKAIVEFLRQQGAPTVEGAFANDAQPLAPPRRPGASERNERVEVVFVSPAP